MTWPLLLVGVGLVLGGALAGAIVTYLTLDAKVDRLAELRWRQKIREFRGKLRCHVCGTTTAEHAGYCSFKGVPR